MCPREEAQPLLKNGLFIECVFGHRLPAQLLRDKVNELYSRTQMLGEGELSQGDA